MTDFIYEQSTGKFYENHGDHRTYLGVGYSGKYPYTNDPDAQHRTGLGPIPRGRWQAGLQRSHSRLGPVTISLGPVGAQEPHRSGFYIHGDNRRGDRSASSGCIILERGLRDRVAFGDIITVVRGV